MMNYREFCEAREDLRYEFRQHLAKQSTDTSNRGRSVRGAILLMRTVHYGDVRIAWRVAYSTVRAQDARHFKSVTAMIDATLAGLILHLISPRKIDQLLGRGI